MNEIPGCFDYAEIYDCMVKNAKDGSHFVEVGSYFGRSAFHMANAIKESGKKIRFDAIDIFTVWNHHDEHLVHKHGSMLNAFKAFMRDGGVEEFVNPIQINSLDGSKLYTDKSLDFVWIDADHSYEAVLADLNAWHPKVKETGCFAGHDYHWSLPGVIQAVNKYFTRPGILFEIQDFYTIGSAWLAK